MQLKLSIVTAGLIASSLLQAEEYVSVQFMSYNENNGRTSIIAPAVTINKDFGTDYTLNVTMTGDGITGGSPTAVDTASGGSAFSRGETDPANVAYDTVDYKDGRFATSALLTTRFDNRDEFTTGLSYSTERDFKSAEVSGDYLHWLGKNKNQAITFGLAYQSNNVFIKNCKTNSMCSAADQAIGASGRETSSLINAQTSFLQNIDKESYIKASAFVISESGYLSSPYHNIVREITGSTNVRVEVEMKPDSRLAYGASLNYANSLTQDLSWISSYRFYTDDWGINSHTLDNDLYYEAGDNWTLKLGLRAYRQSEADFYADFKNTGSFTNQKVASSDERLSSFTALTYKTGFDYKVSKDITVNMSANYYVQDSPSQLKATYFITGFTYNF